MACSSGLWSWCHLADRPPAVALALHVHLSPLLLQPSLGAARTMCSCMALRHGVSACWSAASGGRSSSWVGCKYSNYTAARFRSVNSGWATRRPIEVCHLGLPDVPAKFQAPSHEGPALIVGRMHPAERYKGHDLLLELWPVLLRRHPTARLTVVGEGGDRQRLMTKAASLGLRRRWRSQGAPPKRPYSSSTRSAST